MSCSAEYIENKWLGILTEIGASWKHDKNPRRPYALLRGGMISNVFFNMDRLISYPCHIEDAASDLERKLGILHPYAFRKIQVTWVIGAPYGAITLSHEVAKAMESRVGLAEKGTNGSPVLRFHHEANQCALYVDDVITTGNTTALLISRCREVGMQDFGFIFCIINRTGIRTICNLPVISLISHQDCCVWKRGQNPFTENGLELVEPVSPKTNWEQLTTNY